jgi:lyso-ornithine lipid O-acyltransferase
VFVDRTRRHAVGSTASEMAERLADNATIVLFAEGTSSEGNRVLPLRSSLFGALGLADAERSGKELLQQAPVVQTLALVYTHRHGLPLGRADRPGIGWYGDMDLGPHAWELLSSGPLDVAIRISPPLPVDLYADRKQLAQTAETELRANVIALLRDRKQSN